MTIWMRTQASLRRMRIDGILDVYVDLIRTLTQPLRTTSLITVALHVDGLLN